MKQKKKKDRNIDIIHISDHLKDIVLESSVPGLLDHLKDFIEPKHSEQQILASKAIAKWIQENPAHEIVSSIVHLLCEAYIKTPVKNPLKRALASSLQTASLNILDTSKILSKEIESMFLTEINRCLCREVIDNSLALTENFKLGDECLSAQWYNGLLYVNKALALNTDAYKEAATPVAQTEGVHDCLVTVQVWNKLIQRAERHMEHICEVSKETEKDKLLKVTLAQSLAKIGELLTYDDTVMDVRLTCGLTFPLMLKCLDHQETILQVLTFLFPNLAEQKPIKNLDFVFGACNQLKNTDVTRMCILKGCLAMLSSTDLITEYKSQHVFITDVLGQELLEISQRMQETNSKIIASRTLVLWIQKARVCLDTESSELLSKSLTGTSDIPRRLLQYTWTHWEHPADTIRHHARTIFENVLRCHLSATKEDPQTSKFISNEVNELMSLGWHVKGKYGPLCCIVDLVGPDVLLKQKANLPTVLLESLSEQTLACYVCELYEKLFTKAKTDTVDNDEEWLKMWVDPVLKTLCSGQKTTKSHIIEYIMPKLLKCAPQSISYITTKMANYHYSDDCSDKLGALINCLKRAKMMGLVKQQDLKNYSKQYSGSDMWRGVVLITTLRQALCSHNEQVSLDALGSLCENHRTTEIIPCMDLELVKLFLSYRMCSQSPSFRQQLVASLKKLFIRVKDGSLSLLKKLRDPKQADKELYKEALKAYKNFMEWLCNHCLQQLHLGAAFPSRTTALSVLSMLVHIYGADLAEDGFCDLSFSFSSLLGSQHDQIENLLLCLTDTFENNKTEIYSILEALPFFSLKPEYKDHPGTSLMTEKHAHNLLETALELSSSTRPQDCTTAAYLLRLLIMHYNLALPLKDTCDKYGIPCDVESLEPSDYPMLVMQTRRLLILQVLLKSIQEQVSVARQSLLHAAATRPLYPTLHCIRYVMADQNLKCLEDTGKWQSVAAAIVDVCFEVATTVSPVVSNSSPEGNIPEDAVLGPGLTLDAVVQSDVDKELLSGTEESVKTVNLMPEYLVVCCWRSIKEVSLLLGQLTHTAPLVQNSVVEGENKGLLSVKQIHEIGEYFTKQLLESRHRGAFELAYAGFVKMTEMLWRCPVEGVYSLPKQWLAQIMQDISAHDPTDRLCSTRRSAGVPFYVQALVSTEPAKAGRHCFKNVMSQLLKFAQPEVQQPSKENTSQVHALNILRALFRDTRLADDVFPFIADGMKASIQGYMSQLWSIRNSSTLLFSALMTRVFGVKRTKDDSSKKNCLTGRVFFHRFPSLFEFLLEHLEAATENMSDGSKLHPGLYPVLMVLGRLFPSVIEGVDSSLNIAAFIPAVVKCASSPVYKARLMAARAVRPLVSKDFIVGTLQQLVELLPDLQNGHEGMSIRINHNQVHGALLQIEHILSDANELPQDLLANVQNLFFRALFSNRWFTTSYNTCLSTREAICKTIFTAVSIPAVNKDVQVQLDRILAYLIKQTHAGFAALQLLSSTPGLAQFEQTLTRNLLHCLDNQSSMQIHPQCSTVELIQQLLTTQSYEVRWETLEYLLKFGKYEEFGCEEDTEEETISRSYEDKEQCNRIREEVNSSDVIFRTLVSMLLGRERHQECLVKVCYALCQHKIVNSFPWHTVNRECTPTQILKYLLRMQTASRDEVRCAALELSGVVVKQLLSNNLQEEDTATLSRWVAVVEESCSTEKSVLCRLTCARVLVHNATHLLVNSINSQGADAAVCWTVYVRLLQDEDVDVRQTASSALTHLHDHIHPRYQELLEVSLNLEATLVLDLSLLALVNIMKENHWNQCVNLLLRFITEELEVDWLAQEDKEVRLFDKGEMNTYRDELSFALLAARHLNQLVMETFNEEVEESRKAVISEKLAEIRQVYIDKMESLPAITCKSSFIQTNQLQSDGEYLCRRRLAESALNCDYLGKNVLQVESEKFATSSSLVHQINLHGDFGIWSHFRVDK